MQTNDEQTAPAGGDEQDPRAAQGGTDAAIEATPLDEVKRRLARREHPHLTEDTIRSRIADVTYLCDGTLTICRITMVNGFKVIGKTAPAHDGNFDAEVGKHYAYKDAFSQLWPLEGYLLREWLHQGEQTAAEAAGEAVAAA